MAAQLTTRQKAVLDFITTCIQERGYPPTMREIGNELGIRSTNGVSDHLKALEKKGVLARNFMQSRALRPLVGINQVAEVPVLGRVAAGQPLLAVSEAEETVRIDRFFIGPSREVFALRVSGESMVDAGIFDGDFIFVQKQLKPDPGDVVVAIIEDEATVKYYYPEGDRVRFQPANAAMDPIFVERRDFRSVDILGVVVGVYRKL